MPRPTCSSAVPRRFLKGRAWMSGDGPRTLFPRDRQAANIVLWRSMDCGKVKREIEQ